MEDNKTFFKFHGRPGEDYELWSARTEAALEAQCVLDVVVINVVGTATVEELLSDAEKLKVAKGRAIIMQGLDSKPLRMCLSDRKNPFAMWKRLRDSMPLIMYRHRYSCR